MLKTVICAFLLTICSVAFATEVTVVEDKDALLANHALWLNDTRNMNPNTPAEHIKYARKVSDDYKSGKLEYNFPHSQKGKQIFPLLLNNSLRILNESAKFAQDYNDYLEISERGFMILRHAVMMKSFSYADLNRNIPVGANEAIKDIQTSGQNRGTASELQFVYGFFTNWSYKYAESDGKYPVTTKKEAIERSIYFFNEMKQQTQAPSERSKALGHSVVAMTIDILIKADQCFATYEDFWKFGSNQISYINFVVLEKGIGEHRSLEYAAGYAKSAYKIVLDKLKNCPVK